MDLIVINAIHNPEGWRKALVDEHQYLAGYNLGSFVEADAGTRTMCL